MLLKYWFVDAISQTIFVKSVDFVLCWFFARVRTNANLQHSTNKGDKMVFIKPKPYSLQSADKFVDCYTRKTIACLLAMTADFIILSVSEKSINSAIRSPFFVWILATLSMTRVLSFWAECVSTKRKIQRNLKHTLNLWILRYAQYDKTSQYDKVLCLFA